MQDSSNRNRTSLVPGQVDIAPFSSFWDMDSMMEMQARLWNQMLDSQRNLLSLYAPWMPWLAQQGDAQDAAEVGKEPAETADGLPDPLEYQARSWSRLIDAQRNFWSAFTGPFESAANAGESTAEEGDAADEDDSESSGSAGNSKSASRSTAKKSSGGARRRA